MYFAKTAIDFIPEDGKCGWFRAVVFAKCIFPEPDRNRLNYVVVPLANELDTKLRKNKMNQYYQVRDGGKDFWFPVPEDGIQANILDALDKVRQKRQGKHYLTQI